MALIIIIILILLLIGAVPRWGYSSGWGYGPSGILGVILIVDRHPAAAGPALGARLSARSPTPPRRASGRASAISAAWAWLAVPSSTRFLMPWTMPGEAEQIVGEIPVELVRRPARRNAPNSARRSRRASGCRARRDRVRQAPRRRPRASSTASRDRRNRRADRRASPAPSRAPRSASRRRRTRHCRCDSRRGRSTVRDCSGRVSGRNAISRSISGI